MEVIVCSCLTYNCFYFPDPANPVLTSVTRLPANANETGMIKVTFQVKY